VTRCDPTLCRTSNINLRKDCHIMSTPIIISLHRSCHGVGIRWKRRVRGEDEVRCWGAGARVLAVDGCLFIANPPTRPPSRQHCPRSSAEASSSIAPPRIIVNLLASLSSTLPCRNQIAGRFARGKLYRLRRMDPPNGIRTSLLSGRLVPCALREPNRRLLVPPSVEIS
jgi:hypothetical protein